MSEGSGGQKDILVKPEEKVIVVDNSKRNLLKGLLALGTSFLTRSKISTPHQKDSFSNSLPTSKEKPIEKLSPSQVEEANDYKKQLQERFKIKIASYKEVPDDVKKECQLISGGGSPNSSEANAEFQKACEPIPDTWSLEGLKILESSLSKLPDHFYQSEGKNPTLFVLSSEGCICEPTKKPQLVQLPYNLFNQENQAQAEETIAHELTHRITPKDYSDSGTIHSEWFDQVYKIIGGSFQRPSSTLNQNIDKLSSAINSQNLGHDSQEYLNSRLKYGVTKNYPNELIAVASELYYRGEERFREGMSKIIEPQQVNDMLNFVKGTIYRQVA